MTESYIHVAIRSFLKKEGWLLIAGEYPNGSDDELSVLSISDPAIAKDCSPDPRRHSTGEIVPDLVAYKENKILVIEAKPKYSHADKIKLIDLLGTKKDRLVSALQKFSTGKVIFDHINYENVRYIPVLAFENGSFIPRAEDSCIAHIYVRDLDNCMLCGDVL